MQDNNSHLSSSEVERLGKLLHQRILEAGTLAKAWAGSAVREMKDHWVAESGVDLSGVVTRVDRFIQDYLAAAVRHAKSDIGIIGEESDGLVQTVRTVGKPCLILDPIDGTDFFTRGDQDQYSILATIWDGSEVVWSMGLFPGTGELIVAGPGGACLNTLSRQAAAAPAGRSLMAHYRLLQSEFREERSRVEAAGWNILSNGNGFGTNLGAVRLYHAGMFDVFIAPKMGVVDAWPTAYFLQSLGADLRFYEPARKSWKRCEPWKSMDFGGPIGVRSRFIAARSTALLQEIEELMNG